MTSLHVPSITKLDYNVWRQHSGLPEVYDARYKQATSYHYALRPGKVSPAHSVTSTIH